MGKINRYPAEVRERAVRMAAEHRDEYPSKWAATCSVASKLGMTALDAAILGPPGRDRRWVPERTEHR